MACALHHGAAGRRASAHEQGDPDGALVTHDRDFGGGTVLQHIEQGHDGSGGEVQMGQGAPRLVQHLTQRQLDGLQLRLPAQPFGVGQGGKQAVASGIGR